MFGRIKPALPAPLPDLNDHQVKVLSDDHTAKTTFAAAGHWQVTCACGHVSFDYGRSAVDAHNDHRAAIFAGARRRLAAFDAYQART